MIKRPSQHVADLEQLVDKFIAEAQGLLSGTSPSVVPTPAPVAVEPITTPALPAPKSTALPAQAPFLNVRIFGTDFGNREDWPKNWRRLAYSWAPACTEGSGMSLEGCALPFIVPHGAFVWASYDGGPWIKIPVVDVGPWNTHDDYPTTQTRPEAETGTDRQGRDTNHAGIDFTPGAWRLFTGKTAQQCYDGSLSGYFDFYYCLPGSAFVPPARTPAPITTDDLVRARSAIGHGITYSQDTTGTTGGDDPTASLPGYTHPDGSVTCDCSEYVAWASRYRRADHWNTEAMQSDARGPQLGFLLIPPGQARVGDHFNYYDTARSTGHTGWISQVTNGVPTAVIHCHSGNTPAVQETDCTIFTSHSADILRYHGPTVG